MTTSITDQRQALLPRILFLVGLLFVGFTLVILYWAESLFTESHLAGYYCCVTEVDLPALGSWQRMATDFFSSFIGRQLLSVIFVLVTLGLFLNGVRRSYRWWLPALFGLANVTYYFVETAGVVFSWTLSSRFAGPITSPYRGYDLTWYGIAIHFSIMFLFWGLIWNLERRSRGSDSQL